MSEIFDQTIEARLAAEARHIDDALARAMNELEQGGAIPRIVEAMRYSLLSGGKRLRPILTVWSAAACDAARESALRAAVAMECVHAFSLIHDDLPALDNDETRRGKPTSHVVFGEAAAILAGDALLALAFEQVALSPVPPVRLVAMVATLAKATGAAGMIGGEWLDLEAEGKPTDAEEVERIHLHKTARLIQCACRLGGLSAGAEKRQIAGLSGYGKSLGLAFQIGDDLLDVTGDPTAVGKRTGKDAQRGKATYPGAVGIEAARRRAEALTQGAIDHLGGFGVEADPLRALARYALERTH